jgi:hypothetical protein
MFCDEKLILIVKKINLKNKFFFLATHWNFFATHKCVATPGLRTTGVGIWKIGTKENPFNKCDQPGTKRRISGQNIIKNTFYRYN